MSFHVVEMIYIKIKKYFENRENPKFNLENSNILSLEQYVRVT